MSIPFLPLVPSVVLYTHVVLQFSAVVIWILFEIGSHDATLAGLELCVNHAAFKLTRIPLPCLLNASMTSTVLTWKILIH